MCASVCVRVCLGSFPVYTGVASCLCVCVFVWQALKPEVARDVMKFIAAQQTQEMLEISAAGVI